MWRVSFDGTTYRAARVASNEFFTSDDWRTFSTELRVRMTNDVQAEIIRKETPGNAGHSGATKNVEFDERRGRKK